MSNMQKINEALDGVAAIGRYAEAELRGDDLTNFRQALAGVLESYDLLGDEATGNALAPDYQCRTCTVILRNEDGDGDVLRFNCAASDGAQIERLVREHVRGLYAGQDVDGEVYVTHVFEGHPAMPPESAQNIGY